MQNPNWLVRKYRKEMDCLICRAKFLVPPANNANEPRDERKLIVDEVKFTGRELGDGAFGRVLEYEGTLCTAREVDSISVFVKNDDKVLSQD